MKNKNKQIETICPLGETIGDFSQKTKPNTSLTAKDGEHSKLDKTSDNSPNKTERKCIPSGKEPEKQVQTGSDKLFTKHDLQAFGEFCRDSEREYIIELIKDWGRYNDGSKYLIEMIEKL